MKIQGCETVGVQVNFEGVMPGTHIALRLHTDEGVEGISYISRVNAQNMKPLKLLIESMVENLAGQDATDTTAIYEKLYKPGFGGAPVSGLELRAASAIDVAAWDIKGKALGQPVYKLLGGAQDRLPISANWRLTPAPKDQIAAHLEDVMARGFKAVKCPVGMAELDTAIEHVRFVRECVGPDLKIIVDGGFRWTVKEALRFARETEECDLYWIEDPVAYHNYEGLKHVTETIRQRVCAGEVFQHVHEFRRLIEGRCSDNVMIDQDLGLTGFVRVAHMAGIYGCPVVNHLAPEVLSHGVAAVPNGLIVGLVPWGQPLFTEPMKLEDGELVMPQTSGLGLTLDEDVLKSCAL
jgi:L-alanine-DL-glutamate epimerase-like enolase superfamily enzyme